MTAQTHNLCCKYTLNTLKLLTSDLSAYYKEQQADAAKKGNARAVRKIGGQRQRCSRMLSIINRMLNADKMRDPEENESRN